MHSIRQMLDESPLINAEVNIFAILMCSGRFLVVLSASCSNAVDYSCTFPQIRLCSMYFIANFTGTVYEDSFCLLDAQAGLITLYRIL